MVGVVILNRPEILNAWDRPMRDSLIKSLEAFQADPRIKSIVITGAGERAFGAGQDLNEARTFDSDQAREWVDEWRRLYGTIRALTKPLVCALNGLAAGSAFQVALLADFRIAHEAVRLGQPEINSGLPTATGSWVMLPIIGLSRTVDLTLTGRMVDADEAYRIGLLSRIVPRKEVLSESIALALELSEKASVAMRLNKQRFRELTEVSFQETMNAAQRMHAEAYDSGEPGTFMDRFVQRRTKSDQGG